MATKRTNKKKRSSYGQRTGKYKSKLEALVAKRLGRKGRYETVRLVYQPPSKSYTPDFVVQRKGRDPLFIEVKGYLRYEDQAKMRAVKNSNPEADIRFFFPKDNKVAGSKMTNVEWCLKWGFPCAIGEIPDEWFD